MEAAHCGISAQVYYMCTLAFTDVYSGWTENSSPFKQSSPLGKRSGRRCESYNKLVNFFFPSIRLFVREGFIWDYLLRYTKRGAIGFTLIDLIGLY